ncbi:hypothetical protein [Fictibacillus barbaricus]|uniref:Helix-turn-helix domain-containing protein n=1 Tax=Fictibacillus barbaricus TaxID=182136 RepID=A0ABU1U5E1_9BACL|nr:hypothetical protein [Fictibacillus barbaricus]MDR7074677.1 hypothetical protein [Fictibacillus barbaricus]
MEKTFNVHEAFKILKRHYIIENIQTVSRYIREGRLHGVKATRKDGWMIKEYDLYEFIDEEMPGIVEMVYIYDKYSESVIVPNSESYLKGKKRIIAAEKNLDDVLNKINDELNHLNQQIEQLKKPSSKEKTINGTNPVLQQPSDKSPSIPKKKGNKYEKVKFGKFKELLIEKEIINEVDTDSLENEMKIIYNVYFDDQELMRDNVFKENGYMCPVSQEEMKVFVPLLKKTFPQLLKQIKDKKLVLKEDGTVGPPIEQKVKKEDVKKTPDISKDGEINGEEIELVEEEA